MPRKRRGVEDRLGYPARQLAEELARELKSDRPSGQPMIDEEEFPTGRIRVVVVWDKWDRVSFEDRTATILKAFELAEGTEYRDRIALASGLTVPEARAAGMLPFQIIAAVRDSDPVTVDDCRKAMIEEGASILLDRNRPQLWFPTEEDAEAAKRRLAERLPRSEQVWIIMHEMGSVEDWLHSEAQ